jgi:large subunit ribosomal protein L3
MNGLIGKKVGMTSIFNEDGKNVACTIVEAMPNKVVQIKDNDSDGYAAVQLSYGVAKEKNVTKPMKGHFDKAGVPYAKTIIEFRNFNLAKKLGDDVSIEDVFAVGDLVSAIGTTKGKGFQGVVKRHNFKGVGDATHGQHNRQRAPGSIGAGSYPARVFKGMRMAGQDGVNRVKIKNLRILRILADKNLVLVQGAVPGHKGSIIIIEK